MKPFERKRRVFFSYLISFENSLIFQLQAAFERSSLMLCQVAQIWRIKKIWFMITIIEILLKYFFYSLIAILAISFSL